MAGPKGVPLALGLLVCLWAGISCQDIAPPVIGTPDSARKVLVFYITDLDFDSNAGISNDTSPRYRDAAAAVRMKLLPFGGYIENVVFENGYTCVRATVHWVDVSEANFLNALNFIREGTISLWDREWTLSPAGCNPELTVLSFNLYLSGTPWTDIMADHSSAVYTQIQQQVERDFAELGGQLRTLELGDNNGCIHVFVDWEAQQPGEVIRLTSRVKDAGFTVNNNKVTVSTRPCSPSDAVIDECPPVPKGTVGTCVVGCNDNDPDMACEDGYKCCSNGCGKVCVRVGYKVRVTASLVADGMIPPTLDSASMDKVKLDIANYVKGVFFTMDANPVLNVDVSSLGHKMIAGSDYSKMNFNIYLSEDLPNNDLEARLHRVEGATFSLGADQMRIGQAEFSNNSLHNMRSCGGARCHGICKHLITGEDYCSCSAGRLDPSCSEFDCRKNPFDAGTTLEAVHDQHCVQGQCVVLSGENGECNCPKSYYGERCDVSACSMLNNSCGDHGKCVGLVEQGKLCECEQGWSGIFCDVNNSDDERMSTCEMERRLMQFVHQQVHSTGLAPQLNVFMSTLLRRMRVEAYSVPYCWEADSQRAGEYHSVCHYSSDSGLWVMCECLNSLRQPNSYSYFGPGDCRVFTSGLFRKYDDFYILNMTWTEDLLLDDSDIYMTLKDQISRVARAFGGDVSHVNLMKKEIREMGCVMAGVEWYSSNVGDDGKLSSALEVAGLTVLGHTKKVSKTDCTGNNTASEYVESFTFYVSGLPSPRNVYDNSSMVYQMARQAVMNAFSNVDGKLRTFYLAESDYGCVMFYVEWESTSLLNSFTIMDNLKTNGLKSATETYRVRLKPCEEPDGSGDGCPAVEPDQFGICVELCNAENPCQEGYLCCSNGCGHVCIRVDYKVKVLTMVTVDMDMTMHDDLQNMSSPLYMAMAQGIDMMIKETFNTESPPLVVGTEVRGISRWGYQKKTYPLINVDVFLSGDVPNERLHSAAYLLEKSMLSSVVGQPNILSVEFTSHSMDDVRRCGDVECHGICKTRFSGGDFCSCSAGRLGEGCSSFDCRTDLSEMFPMKSHCQNGQCALETDSNVFECECSPGYHGERCEVSVCDMTINACGSHGQCVGRVEEGDLCRCDNGWGGIFCDQQTTEDSMMSTCERERRLMLFVHEQITGQAPRSPRLSTFMSMLLHRMQSPQYMVPFCSPSDRQYKSVCVYDTNTGNQGYCYCVNPDREPNNMAYHGEGDCRDMTDMFTRDETFFIRPPKDASREDVDMALRNEINMKLQNLNGKLLKMDLYSVGTNCMAVQVSWVSQMQTKVTLVDLLLGSSVMVNGEMVQISPEVCKSETDIDTCPDLMPGHLQLVVNCENSCTRDSECGPDSKCCDSGCLTMTCTEVGFRDKINVDITVDKEWEPQLANSSDLAYMAFKAKVEADLDAEMRRREVRGYLSSKVLKFYPVSVLVASSARKKRQARVLLGIQLELKFNSTVNVGTLQSLSAELQKDGISIDERVFELQRFQFGQVEEDFDTGEKYVMCGTQRCAFGSLCVESVGGIKYCACPDGRSGPSCQEQNCVTSDGSQLCQNGGTCVRIEDSDSGHCECQAGFFGQFCQERVCEYLASNACGLGTCIGDMNVPALCRCPANKGGLFCEKDMPDPETMTTCEKMQRSTEYVVSVWTGLSNDSRIKDIESFVDVLVYDGARIAVPHCWPHDSLKKGAYHSMCQYDMETKTVDRCFCLDEDGNPNFWDYDLETRQCRVYTGDCDVRTCHNGGTCVAMPADKGYCQCPEGFYGISCELKVEGQKCPGGDMPLMAGTEELQCRMGPCPVGFQCIAHPADQWTACCFDEGFLCKSNPCQGGGSCIGNIMNGQICDCPSGRGGLLCEKFESDEGKTPCQIDQRFKDTVISILSGGISPLPGLPVDNLRTILLHNKMEWIPQASCDAEGQYKSVAQAVHVLNPVTTREVCLDTSGMPDPSCRAATCHILSASGVMDVCENGGRCVGDVRRKLCDCERTGYHGFRCQLPGTTRNETACTLGRDIAEYALSVIYDDEMPQILREQMNKVITLIGDEESGVFVPSCDMYGRFEFRGCVHPRQRGGMRMCYCATSDGQIIGEEVSMNKLPEGCDGGKPHGNETDDCPSEWGKECIRPPWWCSSSIKCKPTERCSHLTSPEGDIIECVPKETILPCDYHPCKDNPFAKCSPCGPHGKCYNTIMDHGNGRNPTMGGKPEEDDMERPGMNSGLASGGRTRNAALRCTCSVGYSGEFCDVNTEVCNTVPDHMCEHGCMGDIDRGYLCRCPEGMAGIFCNKQVRTECERRKALYDDAIDILTDKMSVEGYDTDDLKILVSALVSLEEGDSIPQLNCTNTGLYAKIQCQFHLDTESEWCYCANQRGEYISSNVVPYIDFDVCTANGDLRQLKEYYCHKDNPLGQQLCLNGGACNFDVYNGHVCKCRTGYSGAFCEVNKEAEKARSLCEFMASAFDSLHALNTMAIPMSQMAAIINVTSAFTFPIKDHQYFVRPDCTAEGGFDSSAVCYYNVRTKVKDVCFCWGPNGPDFLRQLEAGDDPFNKCAAPMCPDMIKKGCPELQCMGGYRTDLAGCPVCECKHPCEDLHCKSGERCQIDPPKCHKNMTVPGKVMNMDKINMNEGCAMCVPMHKPGVCPDHNMNSYSSILGGALGSGYSADTGNPGTDMDMEGGNDSDNKDSGDDDNDSAMKEDMTCRVACRDDADCSGKKKCCGICGSRCVDPVETFTCSEEASKMDEYLQFLREVEKAVRQSQTSEKDPMEGDTLNLLDRISNVPHVWLPECEEDGHLFKPLQCEYYVDDLEENQTPVPYRCFCVDRLGSRLPGTEGVDHKDPNACLEKSGVCPYLTYKPEDIDTALHTCTGDVDCLGEHKCCPDGVGKVCAPAAKSHMMATTDRLMSALCKINSSMCKGTCMETWENDGVACRCGLRNKYGPFCEHVLDSSIPLRDTVCRRKYVTRLIFEKQFDEHVRNPQGIVLLYQYYIRQMYEMSEDYEWEDDDLTMVKYECTSDGHFEPMQCIRDVMTWTDIACYCVDSNGKELVGTRKHVEDGMPNCGGSDQRMCPVGYPLHNSDGDMLECGQNVNSCPKGYTCTQGAYGNQHCCMTKEGMQNVCHLPADVGMDCEEDEWTDSSSATLYFFDGQQCVQFEFKGCGGNKNRFSSKMDCEKRCKDKVQEGSCPAVPFKVNVKADAAKCKDHCGEDNDCDDAYKCCQSSCGRRCFPTIPKTVERGMCPYGKPQDFCNAVRKCSADHYCKTESIEGGVCCAKYENMNICEIPPQDDGDCSEHTSRFFYNATSMMCEMFMYKGCVPTFNNFKSLEECCGACNGEGRCRPGKCPAVRPGTAISCQDECSADSSCPGKQICCSNGCAKMCVQPQVEMPSDCWERRNAALKSENVGSQNKQCNAVDIPECDKSGYWSRQQCHEAFGLCWCVTPTGNFISDTMTHGPASCDSLTELDIARADQLQVDPATARLEVCPMNETLHCCPRSLCERSCRKYPSASCRINPCGGCQAEYFVDGQQVDCSEGLSKCEKELKEAATTLQEKHITIRTMKKDEDDDMYYDDDMYDDDDSDSENSAESQPKSIRPGIPLRCQLPPSPGPCKGYSEKWYYNPVLGSCHVFVWGLCQGNQNRFDSPAECYDTCNEKADPCKDVTCPSGQECIHKFDRRCRDCGVTAVCAVMDSPNHASGVYTPRCERDGDYDHKQCHDEYCWCVDQDGDYVNGLTTDKFQLQCTDKGMTEDSVVKVEACPNGRQPNISCVRACARQVCPGNPEATCRVDLCSDKCAISFVDEDEMEVDCGGNKCDVFKFDQEDREECSAKLECSGGAVRHCSESVCHSALNSCTKNPCAVCSVDPCTCRPYFVDAISGERLSQEQCDYISLGVCQAKTCTLLNRRAAARLSGESGNTSAPLPECDAQGGFKAKQCDGQNCVCVNEFGFPVGEPSDGTCQDIDKVVKVEVTLSFKGGLSDLNSERKIQAFKNAILKKMEAFGINPDNVKLGEPYEGSIKIDAEIIESPSQTPQIQQNIALASNALKQAVDSGDLDIEVEGQSFSLDPAETMVSAQTASQVGGTTTTTTTTTTARPVDTDGDSGLTDTDKIIIGAVCGGVGLLILIIVCYCCCCRSRQKETPPDDTYDHIRATNRDPTYDKPALYNPAFEEDGHYMKVRM